MRVTHTLTCVQSNYSYWFVLLLSGMCMFSIGLRVKCLNCHNINIHHSMMIKMCCWLPLFIGFVVFAWKTKLNVQTQHLFRFTSLIELINFRISQSHFRKHIHSACPCDTGNSPFPANTIQNWAHSKSDILSTRFIIATRWWWIVFKIVANWTTYIKIECTKYIACVMGKYGIAVNFGAINMILRTISFMKEDFISKSAKKHNEIFVFLSNQHLSSNCTICKIH